MFVLPFIEIEAENEDDARKKYLDKVEQILKVAFPLGVDARELDDSDEDAWKIESNCS
jgi:hypothetical protein